MKNVKGKKLSRKNWIILIFVLIAVISSAIGCFFTLRQGVYLGDRFYHKASGERFVYNSDNYIKWKTDHEFEIVEDGKKKTAFCYVEGDKIRIQFDDEEIDGYWNGETKYITREDGSTVGMDDLQISFNDEEPDILNSAYAYAIAEIAYHDTGEKLWNWILIVIGWICYAIGVASALNPDYSAFFLRRWMYAGEPELSDLGRFMARLGGGICMAFGIILMSGLYPVFANIFA